MGAALQASKISEADLRGESAQAAYALKRSCWVFLRKYRLREDRGAGRIQSLNIYSALSARRREAAPQMSPRFETRHAPGKGGGASLPEYRRARR